MIVFKCAEFIFLNISYIKQSPNYKNPKIHWTQAPSLKLSQKNFHIIKSEHSLNQTSTNPKLTLQKQHPTINI